MPEWVSQAVGPGGALVILIWVIREGSKFLKEIIKDQDVRYAAQVKRLDELHTSTTELHTSTVKHITEMTMVGQEQTAVLRSLKKRIESCPEMPVGGRIAAIKNFREG